MDDKIIVHATISPKVNHQITKHNARPIRGNQRQKLRKLFKSGEKPLKYYLEEMKKTPMNEKIAGNFFNFGNTTRTLQEIATDIQTNKLRMNLKLWLNYLLSYEEKLRSVLEVFDRVGKEIEITENHIRLALNDLHTLYGLHSLQQNDAYEFTATGIEHFMGLLERTV
ncbi:unnamed protein product [Mytilus coruscus]|uniref:Uncharacterized protein n=1 Tax=Mytilus coruscus TaxID=42192 RepID=A0A6J8AMR1_MYTCO|nr:unnamed protein product [Mytilus coruscus]